MREARPRLPEGLWREHSAALRGPREGLIAARAAAREALVAEPFQPEALDRALGKLRTESDAAQVAFHRVLSDMVRSLGPEQRRKLAESRWFSDLDHRGPLHEP